MTNDLKIGIDLGGTKILGVLLDRQDREIGRQIAATPRQDYSATIETLAHMVAALERDGRGTATIGIGVPGAISPASGVMHNANSTWLNDKPFDRDLETALSRPVRLANDANCFALSEATDGAGKDARCVFGIILGTGCGGGIVIDGVLVDGPLGIAGEWGHTPLPWPDRHEYPGPECWCGKSGCLETWLSGPGLAADHARVTNEHLVPEEIVTRANGGDDLAAQTLERHLSRLARGLGVMISILDPDVIVIGGGLSNMAHLYDGVTHLLADYVFSDHAAASVLAPVHGPTSGVRGAARLWDT